MSACFSVPVIYTPCRKPERSGFLGVLTLLTYINLFAGRMYICISLVHWYKLNINKKTPLKTTTCKRFALYQCGGTSRNRWYREPLHYFCINISLCLIILGNYHERNHEEIEGKEKARRSGLCDNLLSLVNNCERGVQSGDCVAHVKRCTFGLLACFNQSRDFLIQSRFQIARCGLYLLARKCVLNNP